MTFFAPYLAGIAETLHADHVGIPCPLDAQDDDPHAGLAFSFQFGEVAVQFRRRPEKQLAFKIEDDHAVAARIVRLAIAEQPIGADGQFADCDPSGTGDKHEDREGHANEDRELDAHEHRGQRGGQHQAGVEARARKRSRRRGLSISPAAVTNSIPASAAVGMNRTSGASTRTQRATAAPAKTPDMRLTAPAWKLMAERVSEPDPGRHWNRPPAKLATPFGKALPIVVQRLAGFPGNGLGDGQGLESPRKAMATALPAISVTHSSFTCGTCGIGRPAGRLPTVRTADEPSTPGWDQPKASRHSGSHAQGQEHVEPRQAVSACHASQH